MLAECDTSSILYREVPQVARISQAPFSRVNVELGAP